MEGVFSAYLLVNIFFALFQVDFISNIKKNGLRVRQVAIAVLVLPAITFLLLVELLQYLLSVTNRLLKSARLNNWWNRKLWEPKTKKEERE